MYEYKAKVISVVDGDTLVLDVDMGFYAHLITRVRLLGFNAPELDTDEGKVIASNVRAWLLNREVKVQTHKQDKYGRWLGMVHLGDVCINDEIVRRLQDITGGGDGVD